MIYWILIWTIHHHWGVLKEDDEGVDTSNILGDLDKDTNYDHSPLQLQEKASDLTKNATQVETKHKPQPLDLKQAVTSFPPLPPPRGNFFFFFGGDKQ